MKKRFMAAAVMLMLFSVLLVGCQTSGMVQKTGNSGAVQPVQISQPVDNIGQNEAIHTVKQTINMNNGKYKINLVSDDLKYNGQEYYQFSVSDSKDSLKPSIIVSKENGAMYCYYPDETVTPIDQDAIFKSMIL